MINGPPAIAIAAGSLALSRFEGRQLRKARPLWQLQVMLAFVIIAPLLLFGAYTGAGIAVAQPRIVQNGLMIEARILSARVDM
jgi:hypothetical protein